MDASAFAAVPAGVARHLRTHSDRAVDEALWELRLNRRAVRPAPS